MSASGNSAMPLRRPVAQPVRTEILETALVLVVAAAAIVVLATLHEGVEGTSPARLASIQTQANATSLSWRAYTETAAEDPIRVQGFRASPAAYEAPEPGSEPVAYRAGKEEAASDQVYGIAATVGASSLPPAVSGAAREHRAAKETSV